MISILVFLIIVAFFVALFAIRIRVSLELQDEVSLTVFAFGARIKILPAKPKKYKIGKYTLKKIAKRDKKAAEAEAKKAAKKAEKAKRKAEEKKKKKEEEAKLTKAEKKAIKAKKKAERPPLPDMISLFARIAKLFFSGLLSHIHFHVARIRIRVGSPDAAKTALTYCAICTALKPTLMFLDKYSNLHGMRRAEIDIAPDYLSEELKLDLKLAFSMSIGGLLGSLIKVGANFLVGWIKIKPSPPEHDAPKKSSAGKKATKEQKKIKS